MRRTMLIPFLALAIVVTPGQAQRLAPSLSSEPNARGAARISLSVPRPQTQPGRSPVVLALGGVLAGTAGTFGGAWIGNEITRDACLLPRRSDIRGRSRRQRAASIGGASGERLPGKLRSRAAGIARHRGGRAGRSRGVTGGGRHAFGSGAATDQLYRDRARDGRLAVRTGQRDLTTGPPRLRMRIQLMQGGGGHEGLWLQCHPQRGICRPRS